MPYPFQTNLHGLPGNVIDECLDGLVDVAAPGDARAESLLEWISKSFGDGISKHFLRPYNEKQWAYPLDGIAPAGADRIVAPDVDSITVGARGRVPCTDFPNAMVSYPASGGFANVWGGFLPFVGDRVREGRVEAIDLQARTLTTDRGELLTYDRLISTMPLTELIACSSGAPSGCREAVAHLRHNSLHLVNVVIGRPISTDMQRIYAADPSVPFHKLVLNSNSSPDLRGRSTFGLQAEVSWSSHKPVAVEGLHERVMEVLVQMGVVEADDSVVASSVLTLDYAYPVYTRETAAARSYLLAELEQLGVLCAGRFGEWLYINSDDAVMRGKAAADRCNADLTLQAKR